MNWRTRAGPSLPWYRKYVDQLDITELPLAPKIAAPDRTCNILSNLLPIGIIHPLVFC